MHLRINKEFSLRSEPTDPERCHIHCPPLGLHTPGEEEQRHQNDV